MDKSTRNANPLSEFELIRRYFLHQQTGRKDVVLAGGDDAAIVVPPVGQELVISTDTLVAKIHFLPDCAAYDIAYKALAVSLSDLAAMGAEPLWFLLNLTMPEANGRWLNDFSQGLFALANAHNVQLIGGDTTAGPLSVSITLHGCLPPGSGLQRNGAKCGDHIFVTGHLGVASLGLQYALGKQTLNANIDEILTRLHRPSAQVKTGIMLRKIASAAIDISDGLMGDLGHILDASEVGAVIYLDKLPLSDAMLANVPKEQATALALAGGDDYELCFTVPPEQVAHLQRTFASSDVTLTQIGMIEKRSGLRFKDKQGQCVAFNVKSWQHFTQVD